MSRKNSDRGDSINCDCFRIDRRRFVQALAAGSLASGGIGTVTADPDPVDTDSNDKIVWKEGRVLPEFQNPKEPLDAIKPTQFGKQEDMLLTTLQGLVNRERPRIYVPRLDANDDPLWPESVDLEATYHDDPWTIVDKYIDEVEGFVVYDPDIGTTVNAATTVAGIEDVVAAHPNQVDRLEDEYDLEAVRDFRGKFETENEVYRWMIDNLLADADDRIVASLPPATSKTGGQRADNPAEKFEYYVELARQDGPFGEVGESTDTLELNLTEEVDVSGDSVYLRFDDLYPEDGFGARLLDVTVETGSGETVADFDTDTEAEAQHLYDENSSGAFGSRFADLDDYWVYEFTIPDDAEELIATVTIENEYLISAASERPPKPRFNGDDPRGIARDYAVATEAMTVWLESGDPTQSALLDEILAQVESASVVWGFVPDEVGGVKQLSENETFLGPSDFFRSGTVWGGPGSGMKEQIQSHRPEQVDPPELDDKIYVTLTASEGDNLQYCQNSLKRSWEDEARGNVPINWSISPLLRDVAPQYLEYFYKTATENDHFMCGPCGIGYAYPKDWPTESFDEFTEITGEYLDKLGIETLYMLNRLGIDSTLSEESAEAYEADTDLIGVALGWDGPDTRTRGDDLVVSNGINGLGGPKDPDGITDGIRTAVPEDWSGDRPVFLSVGVFGFEVTPSEFEQVAENLDDRFEIVRGDVFFRLASQSLKSNDLDDDGLYEDVDGDGDRDIDDVRALFDKSDSDRVTDNPGDFDFDGDGSFSLRDVVALFRDIYN